MALWPRWNNSMTDGSPPHMPKLPALVAGTAILALLGAWAVTAQKGAPPADKKRQQPSVRYEAEAEPPTDETGEKRRDYAVLEAALNDLASPNNPEYKHQIQNVGPGKEIVVNIKTMVADQVIHESLALDQPDRNFVGQDARGVPFDVQEDFKRRSKSPAGSLADFKPANPDIVVEDRDRLLRDGIVGDPFPAIRAKYPAAWGYVFAYPPGYSRDGQSAIVVFYTTIGIHWADWVYMLSKRGKRWEVVWRHYHVRV
jgi:hypothetical protein